MAPPFVPPTPPPLPPESDPRSRLPVRAPSPSSVSPLIYFCIFVQTCPLPRLPSPGHPLWCCSKCRSQFVFSGFLGFHIFYLWRLKKLDNNFDGARKRHQTVNLSAQHCCLQSKDAGHDPIPILKGPAGRGPVAAGRRKGGSPVGGPGSIEGPGEGGEAEGGGEASASYSGGGGGW